MWTYSKTLPEGTLPQFVVVSYTDKREEIAKVWKEDNAQLMASSPILLKALQNIIEEFYKTVRAGNPIGFDLSDTIEGQGLPAIQKATGGT